MNILWRWPILDNRAIPTPWQHWDRQAIPAPWQPWDKHAVPLFTKVFLLHTCRSPCCLLSMLVPLQQRTNITSVTLNSVYRYAYVWCSYRKPELFICHTVFCTFQTQCRKKPSPERHGFVCNVANVFFVGLGRNVAIVSFALTLA